MFDEFLTWVERLFFFGYCLYYLLKAWFYVYKRVENGCLGGIYLVISFLVLIILGVIVKELSSEVREFLLYMFGLLIIYGVGCVNIDKKLKNTS